MTPEKQEKLLELAVKAIDNIGYTRDSNPLDTYCSGVIYGYIIAMQEIENSLKTNLPHGNNQ